MFNYLEQKHILHEKQFGFRAKHSTNQVMLSIVDNIQRAIEGGEYSCWIFLDFAKTFDTMDHGILLKKV